MSVIAPVRPLFDFSGRLALNNYGYEDRASAVGRTGTPDDVGAAVAYLASAEAAWMTGQVLPLNGGALTA